MVPDNHLLRLIDKYIDLSFLLEKVRPYYSDDNGRPSDPTILFKMMFIGYIYGIRSERQLQREIEMNVAYRWFLGLKFKDPVPHDSTISWNRQHRFKGTDIFQEIFDEIVLQAMNHKMEGGRVLFSDSTHLKANANKRDLYVCPNNQELPYSTTNREGIKNISLIRRNVKTAHFFPNVHAPKIREK
ncbi:transposase [Neobacillus sp. B4I6]